MTNPTYILLTIYASGLLLLFIINVIYFSTADQKKEDSIFEYNVFKYSYENVKDRLIKLEIYLETDINYAFDKLDHYNYISKRIKASFIKYEERIERSMVLLYAKKGGDTPVKFLFRQLSPLFKFEVFYTILFFPIILIIYFFFVDLGSVWLELFVFTFFTFVVYTIWFQFTRAVMAIKYNLLIILFSAFKLPTGSLHRNLNCLEYLYHTSYFHRPLLALLIFAGLGSLSGAVKIKSFGGGSFGGGGAGGSW